MWFWHRHQTTKLIAPVAGNYINATDTIGNTSHIHFAIQPSDTIINAPVNGDVLALSLHSITLRSFNNQTYRLKLADAGLGDHFDWQVRIGDTVSPLSILGTLTDKLAPTTMLICEQLIADQQKSVSVPAY